MDLTCEKMKLEINRIILIGNGFDKAHDLKTGYKDFLNNFWNERYNKIEGIAKDLQEITYFKELPIQEETDNKYINVVIFQDNIKEIENKISSEHIVFRQFKDLNEYEYEYEFNICSNKEFHGKGNTFNNIKLLNENKILIKFNNKFLERLCLKQTLQRWVDIEIEYYNSLKECLDKGDEGIEKLNSDFEEVKNLLEKYLVNQKPEYKIDELDSIIFEKPSIEELNMDDEDFINNQASIVLENILNIKNEYNDNAKTLFLGESREEKESKESVACLWNFYRKILVKAYSLLNQPYDDNLKFSNDDSMLDRFFKLEESLQEDAIKKLLLSDEAKNYFEINFSDVLFLNFNYTKTYELYEYGNTKSINIHGSLNDKENPIIFGYGNDSDKRYSELEDKDNNLFLKNMKVIEYLNTNSYKHLLKFLNSQYYQVFIFGHSCGVSDKALLRDIFKNKNCVSIKTFYHKQPNSDVDNFNDISINISRIFGNKAEMHSKVLNKQNCKPLPQQPKFIKPTINIFPKGTAEAIFEK